MQVQEKIKEIISIIEPYFLYIFIGGSRGTPFIRHPKDYDIIVVCKDAENRLSALKKFKENYSLFEIKKEYNLDFHFTTEERQQKFIVFPYDAKDNIITCVKNYCPIEKDLDFVLNNEKELINNYKLLVESLTSDYSNTMYQCKIWYNIYLSVSVLKNRSFSLTEEQIENANILHDRQENQFIERKLLINEIIKEIKQWQI